MIAVSKLNGQKVYLNPHLIESIEEFTDHTKIFFYAEKETYMVVNSARELISKIIAYRQSLGVNGQEI